jgi:hypothetical protein
MNLANLYYAVKVPNMKVIAFNTDSMMVKYKCFAKLTGFDTINMVTGDESNILETIGKIRQEPWKIKARSIFEFEDRELETFEPVKWNEIKEESVDNFTELIGSSRSALISGMPGCGKTEMIKNIYNKDTDIVLSFTNTAVSNAKRRCKEKDGFYTFDSFFNEHLTFKEKLDKAGKYERIIVDEYSMVPFHFMNILNLVQQQFNTTLLFFGDANQCLQIEPGSIIYDYPKTETFKNMCDNNMFICSYKEEYSRYDTTLKSVLDVFLENESVYLPPSLKNKKEKETYINICRTTKKKWEINNQCTERFINEHPDNKTVDISFRDNKKDYSSKLIVGQDLMSGENFKNLDIFNGTICKVVDISDQTVIRAETLDHDIILPIETISKHFQPAFAQTIYRYQGATIREDFTIHELYMMTKRELYTSLSRGVTLSKVHFNYTNKKFYNNDVSKPVKIKNDIDQEVDERYINGKIYKITFENKVYIGQTIRSLEQRFEEHKTAEKGSNFIKELKKYLDVAKIELIENYSCASQKYLSAREKYFIELYADMKDIELLNTIHNRKKVRETVVDIQRIESLNESDNKFHVVIDAKKNIIRYQGKKDDKKVDISVSLNNNTKETAMFKIMKKLEVIYTTSNIIVEF